MTKTDYKFIILTKQFKLNAYEKIIYSDGNGTCCYECKC